jgi:predicted small lipoprotein YifL
MKLPALAMTLALAAVASGCGLKGPLYLPEKPGAVTTRPGPGKAAPATEPHAPAAEPANTPAGTPPSAPQGTSEKTGG